MPVLEVLSKSDTTDVVVVVTRYFGGVLLGTGGLVHAYSGTARLALEAAGPVERIPCLTASLVCSYSQYGKVAALIPAAGGTVDDTLFTAGVELRFTIEPHQLPLLNRQLADATRGEVQAQATGECFISRPVV